MPRTEVTYSEVWGWHRGLAEAHRRWEHPGDIRRV